MRRHKLFVGVTLALWVFGCDLSASADVLVKGYRTKSGKFVAPHRRSSPGSSKANNWSSGGNVSPHTGKAGTARTRRDVDASSYTPSKTVANDDTAVALPDSSKATRVDVGPSQPPVFSSKPAAEMSARDAAINESNKQRMIKAELIKSLGHEVAWWEHSLPALTHMQKRIEAANRLKALGVERNWQSTSLGELEDLEKAAGKAQTLK